MNKINITTNGVLKLLQNININKATGPDGIPGRLLKICAEELASVFRLLFQASLDQGELPKDWKMASVVPLFKKGDKTKAENYRPVSLTSISCKLLEHIVHSNIMDHLDKFNLLNDCQHGFRQKRSCVTQLIATLDDFSNCLNNRGQIDAILLDFSKAFDKVDHEGLLLKLEQLGICKSLLSWSRSFLSGRYQKVIVEGFESNSNPVLSGVPQGTVLGPLFFLIYINDITDNLSPGTIIRLFADDSLLYREIKSKEDVFILQRDLDTLQKWEVTWKMEFHPDKCKLLRITNKIRPIVSQNEIHTVNLEETSAAKYLGVTVDGKLKWKEHYNAVCKKANKILAFLKRNISNCPTKGKSKCVTTMVRPILEYGSPVWDPHQQVDIENLEKIQKRAGRFCTGNYKLETGNTKINMQKLNWKPLEERRAHTKINIIFKARKGLMDVNVNHLAVNNSGTRRGGRAYAIPQSNVNSHLYSFFPNSLRLWNTLPDAAKNSSNIESFKKIVDNITLRSAYTD